MQTQIKLVATFVILSALCACDKGPTTTVPLSWRDLSYTRGPFQKLFVIGVGENDAARRLFEDTFAKALAAEGAAAQPSWGALPQSERLAEADIRAAVEDGDFDGVIVTRLLGVSQERQYVPPTTYTVPSAHYGYGYYGFYGTSYDVVHQPGYYKTNTVFRLETNLYSTATRELVWSGQSDTINPENLRAVIESMTAAVAKKLDREGLLP